MNLYTRLKGNGSKKAIALVHHMDVVPASPQFWDVDPFSGVVKDGYIWGRGALDMKGEGIMHLMAMIALKRAGVPLTRDIVFIGNSDEELGSTGAIVFVKNHPDLLKDVEFLATEGGDNSVVDGRLRYFGIGVAEKRTFWQRLTVKGVPSHGSRPTKQNPVPKLVAALDRIAHYETPLHVTPGVDKYFRDISRMYPEPRKTWLSNVAAALKNPAAKDECLRYDADADRRDRQAELSEGGHQGVWARSVQGREDRVAAWRARKQRAPRCRECRIRGSLRVRHPSLLTIAADRGLTAVRLVLVSEGDSPARQIVRRDFECHSITGENADAKAPHLPRDRRMNVVPVADENLEGRVRQYFGYRSFQFDCFFFGHKPP